jgi:small subunit ribosomal protein MRP21
MPTTSGGYTPLSAEREKRLNGGSSSLDLLNMLNKTKNDSAIDITKMLDPLNSQGLTRKVPEHTISDKAERMVSLKLNPSTGRTVSISGGVDVGRGFRLLEMSCARNRVRGDANKQRFHERGGIKRKRLRRERWRKRFMEGFKATVMRVKQLKKQGW